MKPQKKAMQILKGKFAWGNTGLFPPGGTSSLSAYHVYVIILSTKINKLFQREIVGADTSRNQNQVFEHLVCPQRASLVAQSVKNLPAMQKTRVQSLGLEDPWRRKWLPTTVFLPGKSHGERSLGGYSPWGHPWGHKSQSRLSD